MTAPQGLAGIMAPHGRCWRCVIVPRLVFAFANVPGADPDGGAPGRPSIIANPRGDDRFRELIDRCLASGVRQPEDLQAALRRQYPIAVVRPRMLAGERFQIWYVYRDGHWIGGEG